MSERLVIQEEEPEIRLFHPEWWNTHGTKMYFRPEESTNHRIVIRGSAARLRIRPSHADKWNVEWEVIHAIDEKVNGNVVMDEDDLKSAFGLEDTSHWTGSWVLNRFKGTCARQGSYIRYQNYLNIPGPGTGHDGDPNVSIDIDEEIKTAVAKLLSR